MPPHYIYDWFAVTTILHMYELYALFLQVLPRQTPSDTSSSDCDDHIRGVTTMSWILAIFYYLPLVVTLGMVVLWGVRSFRLVRKGAVVTSGLLKFFINLFYTMSV